MASQGELRGAAYVSKVQEEIASLDRQGVTLVGNAFARVLFVKGEATPAEDADPSTLLSGADGKALRASLVALGYRPEAWAGLLSKGIEASTLRRAIVVIDPDTLVACDEAAADALRNAYADDLASQERLDAAMLAPGVLVRLRGMRVMNLGGFEAALADARKKQVMWARLKLLPPLGEPY